MLVEVTAEKLLQLHPADTDRWSRRAGVGVPQVLCAGLYMYASLLWLGAVSASPISRVYFPGAAMS